MSRHGASSQPAATVFSLSSILKRPVLRRPPSLQYLPHVMPFTLASCNLDDGQVLFDESAANPSAKSNLAGLSSDSDSDDDSDRRRGGSLSIRTGVLDEKSAATQVRFLFCDFAFTLADVSYSVSRAPTTLNYKAEVELLHAHKHPKSSIQTNPSPVSQRTTWLSSLEVSV